MLADAPDTVAAGSLLLLIGGSEDRARGLETALRQSGFAARAAWIADLEELDEAEQEAAYEQREGAPFVPLPLHHQQPPILPWVHAPPTPAAAGAQRAWR